VHFISFNESSCQTAKQTAKALQAFVLDSITAP